MNQDEKLADLKTLSRMAARLSGRDPEEKIVIQIGDIVVFDDVAWRYPDFLKRAEGAYLLLADGLGF